MIFTAIILVTAALGVGLYVWSGVRAWRGTEEAAVRDWLGDREEEPDDAPEPPFAVQEHPPDYAVLFDTGAAWPDVIFVGGFERAHAILARVPAPYRGSVQAVVDLDGALAYLEGQV